MTDDDANKPATVMPEFSNPEERWAWPEADAERRGFKKAPPDHPIYREGVMITFLRHRPKKSRQRGE